VRLAPPDATTLEAIARLALVARRRGAELRLRGPSDELRDLLEFAGLASVLVEG
jgi:anti-anti-sigma regulatory factor